MIIVDLSKMSALVERIGLKQMMSELIAQLFQGYLAFDQFDKSPRQACYVDRGVIELMPICNGQYHAVKWINCHPENVASGKLSIVGLGVWSEVTYGFPLMMTEMTLLTAIRTACATGLFLKHAVTGLEVNSVGLIGAGAQSEFHATMIADSLRLIFGSMTLIPVQLEKFLNNMDKVGINCHRAMSAKHILEIAPVVITLTAHRSINRVIENDWLGDHHVLAAIGGDAPGKTELDPEIIARSDVVVQYLPQTEKEGEIQHGQAFVFASLT